MAKERHPEEWNDEGSSEFLFLGTGFFSLRLQNDEENLGCNVNASRLVKRLGNDFASDVTSLASGHTRLMRLSPRHSTIAISLREIAKRAARSCPSYAWSRLSPFAFVA